MKQPELEIHEEKVADLIPYVNNSKLHDEEQIDTIVASMTKFGNCDPIAIWHNEQGEMEIVEGHGRLLALQKLGVITCPVIYLDHLTDEQRRAYSHVHNQTTLNSGIDFSKIEVDFSELKNFNWENFGFLEEPVFDLNDLFIDAPKKDKELNQITCPNCGEIIEI